MNINLDCGAMARPALAAIVTEGSAHLGFALDGDADRCVAVDERGHVVDGDQLIGIIALDLASLGTPSRRASSSPACFRMADWRGARTRRPAVFP